MVAHLTFIASSLADDDDDDEGDQDGSADDDSHQSVNSDNIGGCGVCTAPSAAADNVDCVHKSPIHPFFVNQEREQLHSFRWVSE